MVHRTATENEQSQVSGIRSETFWIASSPPNAEITFDTAATPHEDYENALAAGTASVMSLYFSGSLNFSLGMSAFRVKSS